MPEDRSKELGSAVDPQPEERGWWPFRAASRRRLSVLLYHHIGDPKPGTSHLSLTVSPAKFRRHVRWLRLRGYNAVTPSQWLAYCATGSPLPRKPIMFTFDDAYADCGVFAFPVLEQFGFESVVYVISDRIGGATSWDGLPVMNLEQLQFWESHGVEIGAHTRTHPDLTITPDHEAVDEIGGSKQELMEAGLTPKSFAYPYGCFDQRVRNCVQGIFPIAFTCEEGLNRKDTDLLLLRRTMVHPGDTLLDIEFRAAIGKSPLDWLRKHVRIRTRLKKALHTLGLRAN